MYLMHFGIKCYGDWESSANIAVNFLTLRVITKMLIEVCRKRRVI